MMNKKYQNATAGSELLKRLKGFSERIQTLENSSQLPEVLTVRKVKLDLRPRSFDAEEVQAIRNSLRISQGVFADFLGVAASTVQDWEQGVTEPRGPACRMMEEMIRDVALWRKRIRELAAVTVE